MKFDQAEIVKIIHWIAVGSAAVLAAFTAISGDVKNVAWVALAISIAQIVHKFSDALDHQQTLATALAAVAPDVEAVVNKEVK